MNNLLIVCVDCLRYDHFWERANRFPELQTLIAENSVTFERAYTCAPWTHPATNSMLTGVYPHRHGARHKGAYRHNAITPWPSRLNPVVPTLFSELKRSGYFTFGISTIYWALNPKCPYSGCDRIIRSEEQEVFYKNTPAEWVLNSLYEVVESVPRNIPFFGYIHLLDLHRPYNLEIARKHLEPALELMEGVEAWDLRPHLHDERQALRFKRLKVALYDALIDYVCTRLEDLLDYFKRKRILDNTTIIITADHGEEFWDHEAYQREHYNCGLRSERPWLVGTGHGHTFFDEVVHVPLILMNAAKTAGLNRCVDPVSLVDVFPTVLETAGVPCPTGIDGRSLLSPKPHRKLLIESPLYGFEKKAIIADNRKYIYSPHERHFTAYDLEADPEERAPMLNPTAPDVLATLDEIFSGNMDSLTEACA